MYETAILIDVGSVFFKPMLHAKAVENVHPVP